MGRRKFGNTGRGKPKFKGKPTGRRQFSTHVKMIAGTSSRPKTFKREEAEDIEDERLEEEESEEESDDSEGEEKKKGTEGIIEIVNPFLVKPKNLKARDRDIDIEKTTKPSRRERKEIEKKEARERYMMLQEQGKTEQAMKDLDRLTLIRQQRADAAKKRDEEKDRLALIRQQRADAAKKRDEENAAKEQKKTEAKRQKKTEARK